MSTSNSPEWKLRAEATRIAQKLKSGKEPFIQRGTPGLTFGIVMDDKILKVSMLWADVEKFTVEEIVEFIVKHMQGKADNG